MSRIKPMTIPAMPTFMCGDMLTPFTHPGRGPPGRPSCF
jgi:hypothetical protein